MPLTISTIRDVAERQLCCGCGACAYVSPDEIEMVDTLEYGRRPLLPEGPPQDPRSDEALHVCPGIELRHTYDRKQPGLIRELEAGWGPILEVWEAYAADADIRFAASSGGAATALVLFCVERLGFRGILHIAARPDVPYLNHTVLSTTRAEIIARTGSRYAPASPCDGLKLIEDAAGPCAFIGKPCDVAGALMAARLRPKLAEKLGLTIAIFCAGTPTTRATLGLLRKLGIGDSSRVLSLRYRGHGWPGRFVVRFLAADGTEQERSLSYEESWACLANDKQWRCHICPDHTGEFADIAVGDPWYREIPSGEPGRSLVVVRTERGMSSVQSAGQAGFLTMERAAPAVLPSSQPNLLAARGAVWGRRLALRCVGIPVPRFVGLPLFRWWRTVLSAAERTQTVFGAVRRVFRRRLNQRVPVRRYGAPSARHSRDYLAQASAGEAAEAVSHG